MSDTPRTDALLEQHGGYMYCSTDAMVRLSRELERALASAEQRIAALQTDGFVLVPDEPTPEMISAGDDAQDRAYKAHADECDASPGYVIREIYLAMLAAQTAATVDDPL